MRVLEKLAYVRHAAEYLRNQVKSNRSRLNCARNGAGLTNSRGPESTTLKYVAFLGDSFDNALSRGLES
jgi:hypothetical protein